MNLDWVGLNPSIYRSTNFYKPKKASVILRSGTKKLGKSKNGNDIKLLIRKSSVSRFHWPKIRKSSVSKPTAPFPEPFFFPVASNFVSHQSCNRHGSRAKWRHCQYRKWLRPIDEAVVCRNGCRLRSTWVCFSLLRLIFVSNPRNDELIACRQDVTAAAMRACRDAISSNSIPAFRRGIWFFGFSVLVRLGIYYEEIWMQVLVIQRLIHGITLNTQNWGHYMLFFSTTKPLNSLGTLN